MWTFKALGEKEQANGFEITFDGPVEDAGSALSIVADKAADLQPEARALAQQALNVAVGYVRDVEAGGEQHGLRRYSVNLNGGVNPKGGWSLNLLLNLADAPPAA